MSILFNNNLILNFFNINFYYFKSFDNNISNIENEEHSIYNSSLLFETTRVFTHGKRVKRQSTLPISSKISEISIFS